MKNPKLPHQDLPARTFLSRALVLPGIASLVLAVYFAATEEWALAAIMVLGVLSSFLLYPWYERRLASRNAAPARPDGTDTV